jgi:hypothetical protein
MANNKAAYTPKQLSTGSEAKIISVTISPKTATVNPDGTQQFTADVVAQGGADETVMWIIEGYASALTTITAAGLLTVGINEIATTITVKAVSNFNPEIFDSATVTIGSVGIEQLTMDNGQLKIYPNPTNGQLTIDNGQLTMENIKIYDIMGRIVNNCQLSTVNCQLKIDVSHLPAGVYFLRIGNKTAKFVKQ